MKRRHSTARAKLLRALLEEEELDWDLVTHKLGVSGSVIRAMEESGVVKVIRETQYRNPVSHLTSRGYGLTLNDEQQEAVDAVWSDYEKGIRSTYLIKGVTGSGKTEVYMELIAKMQKAGRQAIVLIPEIALTYQTVLRFYNRFGDRVSILNSRMSPGERYDQFLRTKNGEIDVMIGPRSALFTPFANLGLIIIDEEHETSYKSETVPRYHARETAIARAAMLDASVVLGSATPSVDSYYRAKRGEYRLLDAHKAREGKTASGMWGGGSAAGIKRGQPLHLKPQVRRADGAAPAGGRTDHALYQPQGCGGLCLLQSLRTCDKMSALRCIAEPACERADGLPLLRVYGAGAGTDVRRADRSTSAGLRLELRRSRWLSENDFRKRACLRMDMDTTRGKEDYEQILSAFANHEADILIGTQMIVKGHDFPDVTLVGVLAADLSLHVGDYRAAERTFQLLTQAAGRAGRGNEAGRGRHPDV